MYPYYNASFTFKYFSIKCMTYFPCIILIIQKGINQSRRILWLYILIPCSIWISDDNTFIMAASITASTSGVNRII